MQTAYTSTPVAGVAGMISAAQPAPEIETRVADGAVTAGLYVISGTTAGKDAKVPAAAFTTTGLGIAHHQPIHATNIFADNEQFSVVRKGRVWVAYEADTVPTADTPAYARHTANGAGKLVLGAIRANSDSSNAAVIPGGMFRRVDTAAGLVEVELSGAIN